MSVEAITLGGARLNGEFPFMNAAGSVNSPDRYRLLTDAGRVVQAPGAIVMIGSITEQPQPGNESLYGGTAYRHVAETGLTYNSMGLPNPGIGTTVALLPQLIEMAGEYDKKLAISLAPVTASPGREWFAMAEAALEAGAEIIEFNAGCPNIYDADGQPKTVLSHVPETMGEALEYVQRRLGPDFNAGLKLSPAPVRDFTARLTAKELSLVQEQAAVINESSMVRYVAGFNTFGGRVPAGADGRQLPLAAPGGAGGVSGPGVANAIRRQTELMLEYLRRDIDFVAAGGINTGAELAERVSMDSRVKLGSAVTALWEASNVGKGIVRLAEEYAGESATCS